MTRSSGPVLELRGAALRYGARTLWHGLDLAVAPGEFVAVLGANGSGKTSLLRVALGLQHLSDGQVLVGGHAVRRGSRYIGYVPQQRRLDPLMPLRARDLVREGVDGHRWGIGLPSRQRRTQVDDALASVGATGFADVPVGVLSGGEQQRVRIAQALASDPHLLLCDEPLLSLDLSSQAAITALVDRRRRTSSTGVVFVTHEINPVLPYVDRVVYLAGGQFRIGSVDEVITSETLTELYGTPVDVLRARDRIVIAGAPDVHAHHHEDVVST